MQSAPRKLTTYQKAVLIRVLLAFPDQQVCVCYAPTATDALAFAQDFLTIFKAVGWTVNDAPSAEIVTDQSAGLALVVNGRGSLPPSAQALRDALRIYGIEVETLCDSDRYIASGSFLLAVGSSVVDAIRVDGELL
jgi:hypothetical protein